MKLAQVVITETVTKVAYVEADKLNRFLSDGQLATIVASQERKGESSTITNVDVYHANVYELDGVTPYWLKN